MTPPPAASRPATARERARVELTREIKEEARRQLTATGADGLSLRAVAKELGMVSSALYRYYPSRDDLLTALIIDAYNALGDAAERAIAGSRPGPGALGRRLGRRPRLGQVEPARVRADLRLTGARLPRPRGDHRSRGPGAAGVRRARAGGAVSRGAAAVPEALPVAGELAGQAAALSAVLARSPGPEGIAGAAAGVPPDALVRAVIGWSQLFGMISFELFGQFVGSFEPAGPLFAHAAAQLAAFVGSALGSATPTDAYR